MTVPNLTFTELRTVLMEYLRRVWYAIRERLSFQTPGSVPFRGLAYVPVVDTSFPVLTLSFFDFSP